MSLHILTIEHERNTSGPPIGPDEHVYPEMVDERYYGVRCISGNGCTGWLECHEKHEFNGLSAADGPNDCDGTQPWWGVEDFEFHGVTHTWRDGHGWTVPYTGCIVQYDTFEPPLEAHQIPIGEYEVDDGWMDTSCYLEFTTDPPTHADPANRRDCLEQGAAT